MPLYDYARFFGQQFLTSARVGAQGTATLGRIFGPDLASLGLQSGPWLAGTAYGTLGGAINLADKLSRGASQAAGAVLSFNPLGGLMGRGWSSPLLQQGPLGLPAPTPMAARRLGYLGLAYTAIRGGLEAGRVRRSTWATDMTTHASLQSVQHPDALNATGDLVLAQAARERLLARYRPEESA